MRTLITNDDGIYSPGIAALAEVARSFGEACMVAPDVEMSSAAHSITASRPLSYKHTPNRPVEAFRVNGTPADCVALGNHIWGGVDLVLSGINLGLNLGNSMWHSGTLAGAKQATLLGLRGIAFSIPVGDDEPDFERVKPWVARALELLMSADDLRLVNVNLPMGEPRGIVWTCQSVRHYDGKVVPGQDPYGRRHYWMTVVPLETANPHTDRWAVEHGYVSMTPLRLDLTDHATLETARTRYPADEVELEAATT